MALRRYKQQDAQARELRVCSLCLAGIIVWCRKQSFLFQSWVHRNEQDYTLLTENNFSREFRLNMGEKKFYEID